MATNPNPSRITDPMWRVWEECARFIPGVRLGGIYANKSGYHNTVAANKAYWPGDYSIRLALDLVKPTDKARAIDLTQSDSEMRKRTGYLKKSALDPVDDRMEPVREFYGTLDNKTVYGLIKDNETGPWRESTSDSSHLWHNHLSVFTKFVNNWVALAGVVSVLAGQSWDEWQERKEDVIGLKRGDTGQEVKALQVILRYTGHYSRDYAVDGIYGTKTSAAVVAACQSVGSSITDGETITGWVYAHIMAALARSQANPGPVGPAGANGKTPTKISISADVVEVTEWVE